MPGLGFSVVASYFQKPKPQAQHPVESTSPGLEHHEEMTTTQWLTIGFRVLGLGARMDAEIGPVPTNFEDQLAQDRY